jgi:hypothetical protein
MVTSLAGMGIVLALRFFSNLVGEEGPRIPGVPVKCDGIFDKDPRVYFLKILSALLTFFRFLQCLF